MSIDNRAYLKIGERILLSRNKAGNDQEVYQITGRVGEGGSAICYEAVRNRNGHLEAGLLKEFYPADDIENNIVYSIFRLKNGQIVPGAGTLDRFVKMRDEYMDAYNLLNDKMLESEDNRLMGNFIQIPELLYELENKAKEGGTDINGALYAVLNAFDKAGTATGSRSVILLTDGKSTINVDEEYLINRANSMNIQINVISLGNHTDKAFIKRITSSTGGKAAKTSSDFYLDAAYGVFLGSHIERCLLVPLIVGYHTAGQILLQILLIAIICITSQAVPTILLRYHSYINWHIKLSPVMILIGAASLAIRDASFSAICFLLVLYLMPFFKGRVKARKLKIRHKKKPHKSRSIPHYTRGDKGYEMMEYYESHNIYDKNIGAFENRNHYTR